MKKLLIACLIVAVSAVALAGNASAAPKPSKKICLQSGGVVAALSIKPAGGSLKLQDGKIKFYAIHGEIAYSGLSIPVVGTGHMDGTVFHFTLKGTYTSELETPVIGVLHMDGDLFTTLDSASIYSWEQRSDGSVDETAVLAFAVTSCTNVVIPYGPAGSTLLQAAGR